VNGGKLFNLGVFSNGYDGNNWTRCLSACFCLPCVVGDVMNYTTGMDYFFACCCIGPNICFTRNIARYHYRIKSGNSGELCEECLTPYCVFTVGTVAAAANLLVAWFCPCIIIAQFAYIVSFTASIQREITVQPRNITKRYLIGHNPNINFPIQNAMPQLYPTTEAYPSIFFQSVAVQSFVDNNPIIISNNNINDNNNINNNNDNIEMFSISTAVECSSVNKNFNPNNKIYTVSDY
jgi:hypothetical protein